LVQHYESLSLCLYLIHFCPAQPVINLTIWQQLDLVKYIFSNHHYKPQKGQEVKNTVQVKMLKDFEIEVFYI